MSVDLTLNQKRPEVVSLKKIKDYHSLFDMQLTTSLETTFFLSKHHMKIELNLLCLRLTFPQTESLICKKKPIIECNSTGALLQTQMSKDL